MSARRCWSNRAAQTRNISAQPTGSADALIRPDQPSAGVSMKPSSCAYSAADGSKRIRNNAATPMARTSARARHAIDMRLASAVSRICWLQESAMTAPSIASHRNTMLASSSVQTIGRWNAKRETTPASRMTISRATSAAAAASTSWVKKRSPDRTILLTLIAANPSKSGQDRAPTAASSSAQASSPNRPCQSL